MGMASFRMSREKNKELEAKKPQPPKEELKSETPKPTKKTTKKED